jgi:hypothetical protein
VWTAIRICPLTGHEEGAVAITESEWILRSLRCQAAVEVAHSARAAMRSEKTVLEHIFASSERGSPVAALRVRRCAAGGEARCRTGEASGQAPSITLVADALKWRAAPPADPSVAGALVPKQLLSIPLLHRRPRRATRLRSGGADLAAAFRKWRDRLAR